MSKHIVRMGECCICGQNGPLSEEHIPPRAAYNKGRVIEYELKDVAAASKDKGRITQGGVRQYTLCKRCNNDTGRWYGGEYVGWAKTCMEIIQVWKQNQVEQGTIVLHNVFPLRFLKQVVTCLFSVIGQYAGAAYARNNPDLAKFVLDKHNRMLPSEYHFYLNLYPFSEAQNTQLRRYPFAGKLTISRDANGNLTPLYSSMPTEMTHPPFQLVMTTGHLFPGATEITHLKDYEYNAQVDLKIELKVIGSSSPYPGSFS